ncbi:MAG: 1-deoxy-D-xylulose-5-phosphate synthase [Candidatus Omnitrophica bacterium]|nr:1-deoxy-D-xylulose-5-phosphate synthase [Candidatus Omnitrophota bacterium]
MQKVLSKINSPNDLKPLSVEELSVLSEEVRQLIVESVSPCGGHLAANLGTVELTIALHYVLNSPADKIVWDVGHQAYTHKILTGRRDRFGTLRQENGISGFPNIHESPHDHFTVGHASTSLSQAVGLAVARDLAGDKYRVVAVCGDGSLTGGLAFEALNNIGHMHNNMLIILNDNEMAISKSIGSMSKYLNQIITNPAYNRVRSDIEHTIRRFPRIKRFAKKIEESFKNIICPGLVFEELGVRYFGPIDGHDIENMIETIKNVVNLEQPCLLHVLTKKGKGVHQAEDEPASYHSSGPYTIEGKKNGIYIVNPKDKQRNEIQYTKAFSNCMLRVADRDDKVVAITAAMPDGTGLAEFSEKYPHRFFDVGIAEGHAITFAGALSRGGYKPVCAIYSTFLQRAYDNLLHDAALQDANVTLCLDRAGIVGPDGATHHGLFDIAYLRTVPNSVVCAPKDEAEMQRMLDLGIEYKGVFAIRYPKDLISMTFTNTYAYFGIGEGEVLCEGDDAAILSLGNTVVTALKVASLLRLEGINAGVYNMRFAKPLDAQLLSQLRSKTHYFVTIEEHVETGGFGSAVLEFMSKIGAFDCTVKVFAFPNTFIQHGSREKLFERYGMDEGSISKEIIGDFKKCKRSV